MGLYEVTAPCAFSNADGTATVLKTLGALVEVDDDTAASLPLALRLYADGSSAPEPENHSTDDPNTNDPNVDEQGPTPDGTPVTFVEPETDTPATDSRKRRGRADGD